MSATPFPFLVGVKPDVIPIVHHAILSDLNIVQKDQIISTALDKENFERYTVWGRRDIQTFLILETPPVEVLRILRPQENAHLYSCIAENRIEEIASCAELLYGEARAKFEEWYRLINDSPATARRIFGDAKSELIAFFLNERADTRDAPVVLTKKASPTVQCKQKDDPSWRMEAELEKAKTESVTSAPKTRPRTKPALFGSNVEQDFAVAREVDPKNVFNILLLGETGVGKTTFINSFANYLEYSTIGEALAKTPRILMDTSFTYADNSKLKQKLIDVKSNCAKGTKNSFNENLGSGGQSRTQDPLLHALTWNDSGTLKMIRIVDTPGINDTRGQDQDEMNFEKILSLIAHVGKLHAICILLKPNESKLSMGFRNCMDNLLVKLHRSATTNILFCFTNTRSTLYRPGDTIAPLQQYLSQIEKTTGVVIKSNRDNMFCFDNDCFRYMCILLQHPIERNQATHKTLSSGWEHNVAECKKLLKRVQGMIAHNVEDTVDINRTRSLLIAMARPLTEVAQNHLVNKRMVEDQIEEIELLKGRDASLTIKVEQKQLMVEKIPLRYPKTVCTEKKCNDMVDAGNGEMYAVPKKPCHDHCYLQGISPEELANKALVTCEIFKKDRETCEHCGCHWTKHMHIRYEIKKTMRTIVNRQVQGELAQCKDNKKRAEILLKDLQNQLENIENEYHMIKESSMEFSAYLKYNSVKQGVDPYFDYISHIVQTEENKLAHGGSKFIWLELRSMLNEYIQGVQYILDEIKNKRRAPLSSDELHRMILALGHMKLSGSLIAEIASAATEAEMEKDCIVNSDRLIAPNSPIKATKSPQNDCIVNSDRLIEPNSPIKATKSPQRTITMARLTS